MTDLVVTALRAMQQQFRRGKTKIERARDALDALPPPDPVGAIDAGPRPLTEDEQRHIANDLDVLETAIATIDRAVEHVEAGRQQDARGLLEALGDLGKQFTYQPGRPATGDEKT